MKEVVISSVENIIHINGILNANTVEYALEQTKPLISYDETITLHLGNVTNCDSAGLTFLTAILREAKKKRTKLLFNNVPKQMLDLGRVSGLDGLLTIVKS